MNILAMDLGKYKTVFCEYSAIDGEHTFGAVKTTPQEIHDLLVEKEPDRVVMEVCGIAGWIGDITEVLGIETETACAMHDAWRWKNVKKKTDKEDALKLAKLSAMGQLPTVHMPPKPVREKRAILKHRQRLVHYRTSCACQAAMGPPCRGEIGSACSLKRWHVGPRRSVHVV
jgi:hypothetical protein